MTAKEKPAHVAGRPTPTNRSSRAYPAGAAVTTTCRRKRAAEITRPRSALVKSYPDLTPGN